MLRKLLFAKEKHQRSPQKLSGAEILQYLSYTGEKSRNFFYRYKRKKLAGRSLNFINIVFKEK